MTSEEKIQKMVSSGMNEDEARFIQAIEDGEIDGDIIKVDEYSDETKTMNETYGLRPDELELPARIDDPHGMAFTDEEVALLTATDNEAAVALAFATATPEKLALLKAKE